MAEGKRGNMIYDAYGRPINTSELTREHAAPTLTGIRSIWDEAVASGLTPARLTALLHAAVDGDHRDYLTLAEEMEERDLHYAGVIGVRKRAVCGLPVSVEAASDDSKDVKIADDVRELVRRPEFDDLIENAMDALGKAFSVNEIMWRRSERKWWPAEYKWRDPRFFVFDRETKSELRILDEANASEGLPMAPYKFIVHYPRLKCGLPIRNGIARIAAWAYLFKNYTIKDWLAFGEIFGMPFRIGRYGTAAKAAEIDILKTAVANLGSDAAAVIPKSMEIEFIESVKTQGADGFFKVLADWMDYQVEFLILGQSGTTQGTPGKLGSDDTQNDVRKDIRDSDAKQLGKTISKDLIKPYVDLNYGPQENYPRVFFETAEPEDIEALSSALQKLVPLGLRVEASVIRDRMGLPDPPEGAEVLSAKQAAGPQSGASEPALEPETDSAANKAAAKAPKKEDDILDELVRIASKSASDEMPKMIEAVLEMVNNATNYQEIGEKLFDLFPSLDPDKFQDLLAKAMFVSALIGASEEQESAQK